MEPRRATTQDMPLLLALAVKEHAASQFCDQPFDFRAAQQSLSQFVAGLATTVIVTPGGFIAGMVQPTLFNRFWNAYEMAWFATDGSGMALLQALTKWARGMRAQSLVVHNYAGQVPADRFTRVMRRRGFEPMGMAYTQTLGDL